MPFATNPIDGVRVRFEDSDAAARPPVLVYPGFTDRLEYAQNLPLVRALESEFRLIFADHRGQGRGDKPHDVEAYRLGTRVADAVAVLDGAGVERAHFLGFSWGARLGFAFGELAPERARSLVLFGNQPYAWDIDGPMWQAVARAVAAGVKGGTEDMVNAWEAEIHESFPEPGRRWMLDNDPLALDAAFRSTALEGVISKDLSRWRLPCLIGAGEHDPMRDQAMRAAAEIPGARFIELRGQTHYSAERVSEELLGPVLEVLRSS